MRMTTFLASVAIGALAVSATATYAADAAGNTEEIVVTGARAEKTARTEQKAAPNLVSIQSAEAIAKYPDYNAAEALGRVSGVALSIDTGEGRFVNIRGLDGNLNGATFGGATLLNTQAGGTYFNASGRAVEFDTVPVGAIDRIVVTKTPLPDHDAEGLGGSIELTPRSALAHDKFFVEGTLGEGYEPARKTTNLNEELVVGGGFGDNGNGGKLFHVVLTQFQHNDGRGFDDIEAAYADGQPAIPDKAFNALELRRYRYHRERSGYSAELDITPNTDHRIFARFSLAGYTERVNRQRLEIDGLDGSNGSGVVTLAGNKITVPDASAVNTLRDEKETHRNLILQVGGEHKFNAVKVDWLASFVRATYDKPFDFNSTFSGPGDGNNVAAPFSATYDNISDPNFPKLTVVGVDLADPKAFILKRIQNQTEYDKDQEYSYLGNVSLPVGLTSNDEFKFGGKLRYRNKYRLVSNRLTFKGTGQPLTSFLGDGPFTNYYKGTYNIGYSANGPALAALAGNAVIPPALTAANTNFNDIEDVYAGYAQYQGSLGALHFLVGARVENTKTALSGFVDVTNAAGVTTTNYLTLNKNYTNVFPTAQLKYDIMPKLVARATYSTGLARPGFLQTIQNGSVDFANKIVTTGNPDLKPTYGHNFDLSLEYYLPNSGVISVGVFDKEFKNYIVSRTFIAPYQGQANFNYQSFQNVSGAFARGVELNFVNKFTKLPAPFDGLGVDLNWAFVDSGVSLRNGEPSRLLPGTFGTTGNAALFYEAHKLQLRLALQYESKALFGIGGSPVLDVYQDKRVTLDFTGAYDFTKNVKVYWSAKNLTDAPLRFYEGTSNRPIQREFYGVTYEAGVKVKL